MLEGGDSAVQSRVADMASSSVVDAENNGDNQPQRKIRRKAKRVSIIDALRKKYCDAEDHKMTTKGVVIVFHGKPKSDGTAELDYLRNVVLSNSNIVEAGLNGQSLQDLCPNVVDLDLSGNRLESWAEVLPAVSQLKNMKFLNLSDNRFQNTEGYLQEWCESLPGVENLVLNRTYISWEDVLCLAQKLCGLKELHLCGNGYTGVPGSGLQGLETVECLRLNGNQLQTWSEIWKLRVLSGLKTLILSVNPLLDVFFEEEKAKTCACTKADEDKNISQTDPPKLLTNSGVHSPEHPQNTEEKVAEEIVKETDSEHLDASNKLEIKPKMVCDIVDRLEAVDDKHEVAFNADIDVNRENDQTEKKIGEAAQDVSLDDMVNNGSDPNAIEEEVDIEAWCNTIICDIIAEIAQKRPSITGAQPHGKNEPEICDKTPQQSDTDSELSRLKSGQNTNEIGNSLNCSDRGDSDTGSDVTNASLSKELSQGDHSDVKSSMGSNSGSFNPKACKCDSLTKSSPFASLETLCLSETGLGKWKHLTAVNKFPALKSVRIKDVKLGGRLSQDDRRKLFVACLPKIKMLNGSEVSVTEREKAERHLLRHFGDKKQKPEIFHTLEQKHGKLAPLVDIDISRGYKEVVTLTFVYRGETMFTDTVRVREPVGKLRIMIAEKLSLYASFRNIQMYHRFCSPCHQDQINDGEEPRQLEQLFLDSLPMSRFDIMDEDEIHFDFDDQFTTGAMKYVYLRNYMPRKM